MIRYNLISCNIKHHVHTFISETEFTIHSPWSWIPLTEEFCCWCSYRYPHFILSLRQRGKGGCLHLPYPPQCQIVISSAQLFSIGLLWTVLMEMDSSARRHHLCVFFISLFPLLSFYTCYVRVFVFVCFNKMCWMSVNDSIKNFFFSVLKDWAIASVIFFFKEKS